jgi:hypothetical protein
MRRHCVFPLAVLALAAGLSACARGVALNTDPGQSYAVNVRNPMPHAMIVSFDDGSGERLLGTVAANRTERFIVAGTARPTITIVAKDEGDTHTVRRTVTLMAGETVEVSLGG